MAGRSTRCSQVLAAVGLADLEDVAARCVQLRADLGLPVGLWTVERLADVLAAAVLDSGWPAAAAVPALLAVAADPATRSPARLPCPGPWWDAHTGPAGGSGGSDDQTSSAELEAVLVETGGLRVALQRQARAELEREQVALTRSSVSRRAVEILRRGTPVAALVTEVAADTGSVPVPDPRGFRCDRVRSAGASAPARVPCPVPS